MNTIRRLLVVRDDKIGDMCISVPILNALQTLSPETRVIWAGKREVLPLVKDHPMIEGLLPLTGKIGMIEQLRVLQSLKRFRPDAVLLLRLPTRRRWRKLMVSGGVPIRVGAHHEDDGRLTHNIYEPGLEWFRRRQARKALDMLAAALDAPVPDTPATLIFSEETQTAALAKIAAYHLPADYFVIQLGTGGSSLQMPPEFFAKVASTVPISCVLTGVASENDQAKVFRVGYSGNCTDLIGKTSLAELAEVLRKARFVFSVDTSTIHIAAGVQTPSVVVMPRRCHHPDHWSPWLVESIIVRPIQFCPQCNDYYCLKGETVCVESVPLKEAIEACQKMLLLTRSTIL
jgi:heptosyltransferase-3